MNITSIEVVIGLNERLSCKLNFPIKHFLKTPPVLLKSALQNPTWPTLQFFVSTGPLWPAAVGPFWLESGLQPQSPMMAPTWSRCGMIPNTDHCIMVRVRLNLADSGPCPARL